MYYLYFFTLPKGHFPIADLIYDTTSHLVIILNDDTRLL